MTFQAYDGCGGVGGVKVPLRGLACGDVFKEEAAKEAATAKEAAKEAAAAAAR